MTITFKGIEPVIKNFSKFAKIQPTAVSQALNYSARAGQTGASRAMRKEWVGLPASTLKAYQYIQPATRSKQDVQFNVTSRSINLMEFGAKQNKKGVSYRLKTKRRTMKGAFTTPSGYFLKRRTKARDSIIPYFSITPTSMFIGANGSDIYVGKFFNTFNQRYFNRVDQLLKK